VGEVGKQISGLSVIISIVNRPDGFLLVEFTKNFNVALQLNEIFLEVGVAQFLL